MHLLLPNFCVVVIIIYPDIPFYYIIFHVCNVYYPFFLSPVVRVEGRSWSAGVVYILAR